MIDEIEIKLLNGKWKKYKNLYQYIKSLHFQKQISEGLNPSEIRFNIEDLVGLLEIIIGIAKGKIDIYVFVGSWEKDLTDFITKERNENERLVSSFREALIKELLGVWLVPKDWKKNSMYFSKIIDFKKSLDGFPLRIFTLNYDLCLEQNLKKENIEIGFDEYDNWDFRRYDDHDSNSIIDYYVYKLHGSMNWEKTEEEKIIKKEGDITTENLAIIFGVTNKLQSYDPYLFYFYELRERCLSANVIICSGYSFMDAHINDLIKYGLKDFPHKKLVVNNYEEKDDEQIKKNIIDKINISNEQIIIYNKRAKEYFENDLNKETISDYYKDEDIELPDNF
jgi:hypothetical protein